MALSPSPSLRDIAAQVNRSHTHVRRLVIENNLQDAPRPLVLVAARLVFEHDFSPAAVSEWAHRQSAVPTEGFVVQVNGRVTTQTQDGMVDLVTDPGIAGLKYARCDHLSTSRAVTTQASAA